MRPEGDPPAPRALWRASWWCLQARHAGRDCAKAAGSWATRLRGCGHTRHGQPIAAGSSASAGRRPTFGLVVRSALRADLFKKHPSLLPAESRRGSPAPALRDRRSRDVTCLLDSFGPGRLACLPRLPGRHFGWWSHLGVPPPNHIGVSGMPARRLSRGLL